jgi:hypothetical protein
VARIEIPGTDDDLKVAVRDVNLPNLLLVMNVLTGDESWLDKRYQPGPIVTPEGSLFPDDTGAYAPEIADEIRTKAFAALKRLRDDRPR